MSNFAVKFKASAVTLKSTHFIKSFFSSCSDSVSFSLAKETKNKTEETKSSNTRKMAIILGLILKDLINNKNTPYKYIEKLE